MDIEYRKFLQNEIHKDTMVSNQYHRLIIKRKENTRTDKNIRMENFNSNLETNKKNQKSI